MPIYEYKCQKCGEEFELLRNMSDSDKGITCPKCGEKSPKRVLSVFGTTSSNSGCAPTGSG